ncbi:hypothetical protein H4R35_001514 [Dimargaris xerosporica]|nr:hypothetical protein H4R35_001514 [Dimargaris xerosporica]
MRFNCRLLHWVRVPDELVNARLDRFLHRYLAISVSEAQKAIRLKQITVLQSTGAHAPAPVANPTPGLRVEKGLAIGVPDCYRDTSTAVPTEDYAGLPPTPSLAQLPHLPLPVRYIDPAIMIIDKPPGLATQGGPKIHKSVNDILSDYPFAPRLVHRLDKDTSGLMILARTKQAATAMAELFQKSQIYKKYVAILDGSPNLTHVRKRHISHPIGVQVHEQGETMMAVRKPTPGVADIKPALTQFIVHQASATNQRPYTCVSLQPKTGRKHQLRVHCAQVLGAPILGDSKYGSSTGAQRNAGGLRRQALHLAQLVLPTVNVYGHRTQGHVTVHAPLPSDMARCLRQLFPQPTMVVQQLLKDSSI